jgi:hypothetical protein
LGLKYFGTAQEAVISKQFVGLERAIRKEVEVHRLAMAEIYGDRGATVKHKGMSIDRSKLGP